MQKKTLKSIVALVTTTKKNKRHFEHLMKSIYLQSILVEKIIIIYDGAVRPEKETFEDCPLPITWIDNREEQPLTCLQNKSISNAAVDFILLLNDDIMLGDDFIKQLIVSFEIDHDIGMVCPKLLRVDKKTIDSAGQLLGRNRSPVERGFNMPDIGQFDKAEFVFGACGAAVLLRRKMLEDCAISSGEFFDNDYNMFYEDLDLSWRAANRGWKTYYNPSAVAYHVRGATAKAKKPAFEFLYPFNFVWLDSSLKSDLIKNRLMTMIKNDSIKGIILNASYIIAYDLKLFFYCLIFDPSVIMRFFRNLPVICGALKKRKMIKKVKRKK